MEEELVAGVKHLTKDNKTCINIPQILVLGSACVRKWCVGLWGRVHFTGGNPHRQR